MENNEFCGMGPDKAPRHSVERQNVVEKVDFASFKEKQSLETLRLMIAQMYDSVCRATDTTDVSAYNSFNAAAFLTDADEMRTHVVREFPRYQ